MALCIVAFLPSKSLLKYLDSFIRWNAQQPSSKSLPYIEWCGERLRSRRIGERKMVRVLHIVIPVSKANQPIR